jgi:predicted nucleic acid-binding protein
LGIGRLGVFLKRHRRIALDTGIFIYHLEEYPVYAAMAGEIFTWLEGTPHTAVTSTLTMTELLVQPYRAGNDLLVNKYYGLLSTFPNRDWVAPDLAIADAAAQIRGHLHLRTLDAMQAATGICRGATAILTNDSDLTRLHQIEVGVLERLR